MGGATSSEALSEAAGVCEAVVPHPRLAIELYAKAYEAGASDAHCERAILLARQCGDFGSIASIASLRYASTAAPSHLEVRACALIDAGEMELAKDAVHRALRSGVQSEQLYAVESAFGVTGESSSKITSDLESRAYCAREASAKSSLLLAAARVAHICNRPKEREAWLLGAMEAAPGETTAFAALENTWIEAREWDRLSFSLIVQTC